MSEQQIDNSAAGVRYPFINLEKAIGRAKEIFDADTKGREMSISAAFAVWEYSEKSSGGFQTVAALKMYGLLKDASGSDGRKIALTEAALRYFRDEREEERQKHIRDFALKPKLIAVLWRDWHASPPADAVARSHLKADRQLSDQGARSLLAIYKENLAFAYLTGESKVLLSDADEAEPTASKIVTPPPAQPIEIGDLVQWETEDGTLKLEKPARVRAVREYEGRKWVLIDGSYAGIPKQQTILDQKGLGGGNPVAPPRLALDDPNPGVQPTATEREWLRGPLSRETTYRLIVSGDLGPKEIGKLIRLLEAQKSILSDDDDATAN